MSTLPLTTDDYDSDANLPLAECHINTPSPIRWRHTVGVKTTTIALASDESDTDSSLSNLERDDSDYNEVITAFNDDFWRKLGPIGNSSNVIELSDSSPEPIAPKIRKPTETYVSETSVKVSTPVESTRSSVPIVRKLPEFSDVSDSDIEKYLKPPKSRSQVRNRKRKEKRHRQVLEAKKHGAICGEQVLHLHRKKSKFDRQIKKLYKTGLKAAKQSAAREGTKGGSTRRASEDLIRKAKVYAGLALNHEEYIKKPTINDHTPKIFSDAELTAYIHKLVYK